jgi:hypothetical protein
MMKHLVFTIVTGLLFTGSIMSCKKEGRKTHATDTLAYEFKTLTTTYNNCLIDSPDCTHITYTYPVFSGNNASVDSVNELIKFILGEKAGGHSLQSSHDHFINDYKVYLKDSGPKHSWYSQTRIDVPYQHNNIVCLKVDMDDYTGGAHGMISTFYQILDKTTNTPLLQTKLIKKEHHAEVLDMAEKQFRANAGLSETSDLEKAGYWFKDNKFYLTENYCITQDGITWLYNPYEIAAYAHGTIEVSISKDDLLPFINETYQDIWD